MRSGDWWQPRGVCGGFHEARLHESRANQRIVVRDRLVAAHCLMTRRLVFPPFQIGNGSRYINHHTFPPVLFAYSHGIVYTLYRDAM